LFTDGRDSSPTQSIEFVTTLNQKIKELGVGQIVNLCGRYYAMDRDKNYDRIKKAYDLLVLGKSDAVEKDPILALKNSHQKGITDEFLLPTVIQTKQESPITIQNGDSVIFFNYRGDRARQLTRALTEPEFHEFERANLNNLNFVGFTEYDHTLSHAKVAFYRQNMKNTLGEVLSHEGCSQLRIAETTKYAHVTYFFNGGVEVPYYNEDRILIKTKEVKTFDLLPEMSAMEIANTVTQVVEEEKYDFVLINFANCDMVGHTGNLQAAIKAVEVVDTALGVVLEHFKKIGATTLVTADHGNAETMLTKEGLPHTAHTTNLVPFVLVDDSYKNAILQKGILSDVSATVLDLLQLNKPSEFTANSLLKK
jgi:2,3-bisphosphoglycerate-independent phosphoglycerate mutase